MELELFLDGLTKSLVNRGIPAETAARHVASLMRTFTEDDRKEIQNIRSTDEIDAIADSIAAIIYKKSQSARPAAAAGQSSVSPQTASAPPVREKPDTPAASNTNAPYGRPAPESKPAPRPAEQPPVRYAQNSDDFFKAPAGKDKTTKGVAIFWTVLILTLPVTAGILAAILAAFGILFLALILMIIGLVLGMIALVGAGSGVALVGIIYGITQLFSFVAAGVYEIGLGVMIGGGVLLAGVILYNLAIRFLPWVMKWLTVLFVFVFGQLRNLFYLARRECYKL